MVLGGKAFGRWIGHKDEALMNGISALTEGTPESSLTPSTIWGHRKMSAVCNLEEGFHQTSDLLLTRSWASSLHNCEK